MSKILAQGMITLTQLYEGVQVILTPTAVLIPCDSEETPKPNAYINASTNVKAFLGTMDITSGITLGELEYSDSTVKASKTGTKVSITAITTRTGYVDIPVSATINGETIDLGKHRFNFVKQIDGQPGIPGDPGFGYTLNIKGGVRGVAYAANGTNPEPKTSSQFSVELLKNGVKVANPASISWTCGGNLSGSSSAATFTPTIKSTYNSESSYVKVSVKEFAASLAVEETIPIICTKHADGLDWINEWNNQYVQVGTEKIITPKIFAGTKNSSNELTGVAIGRDVLGGNANKVIGIVGYKKNTPVFSLDQDANFFVSSSGNAGDIKNGTNNAKGIYFDGNNLYVSGKVKINGGSTIGENNTSVEEVINNSNLGVQANNKLDNLSIGGRNLIRKADLAQNNSTATYDGATNTWTINATAGAGGAWGCGLVVKNKNAVVPYGKSYVLSFEIKVPRACSWNCDVNTYALTGSSWSGNDNDNGSKRTTSSKSLVANQWIKCWVKWENTNPNNTNKVDIYDNSHFGVVMKDETSNMTYQIRNVKGELGNVPTEWTPAPEDIQADIESVNNSLTDKIDAIQIGGRNLATHTNQGTTGWVWGLQTGGKTISEVTENGIRCCKMVRDNVASTGWSHISYSRIGRDKYLPNKQYTVSFEVKSSVATDFWCSLREGNSSNPLNVSDVKATVSKANTWTKLSFTLTTKDTLPTSTTQGVYLASMNSGTGVSYIFRNLMIEEGTKASSWTPAPEDLDQNISDVKNSLNSFQNTVNTTFKDGIIEQAEAKAIAQHLKTLDAEKSDIDKEYSAIYSNANLTGSAKTNLASAKTSFDSAHDSLKSTINTVISDGRVSSSESASVTSTFNTYNTQLGVYKQRAQEALDAISSAKVNNIQIGATNYLRQSGDYSSPYWINKGATITNEYYMGSKVYKVNAQWGAMAYKKNKELELEPETEYILSAYIKKDSGITYNSGTNMSWYGLSTATPVVALDNLTTSWKQYSVKRKGKEITVHSDGNGIRIEPNNTITGGYIYVAGIQIEKGNKATDWKPAPEDVNSNINDVKNSLNSFQNTVNTTFKDGIIEQAEAKAIAQHLKTLDAEKADVDKEYSTIYGNSLLGGTAKTNLANAKTSFDSAHNSLKSTINTVISDGKVTSTEKASVDSAFTTYNGVLGTYKQRVQEALDAIGSAKVDNVQVGGRNLAEGTSDSWKSASGFSGATNYCVLHHVINTKTLSVGDKLTVSFRFKCENLTNNNSSARIRMQGSGDVTGWNSGSFHNYDVPLDYSKPTQEIKVNYTFTINADHLKNSKWHIDFRTDFITGGTIYLKELLAEKGTKASSWTPAPEDIDNNITDVKNSLSGFQNTVNTTFKDGIIEQAEAKAIARHIQILDTEKADVDKEYSIVYNNSALSGTAKTNLASAKTEFDNAHTSLKSTINTAIADGKVTSSEKTSVDNTFSIYNSILGTYKQRVQEALDAISSAKVNNIQIGGRNLWKFTKEYDGTKYNGWVDNNNGTAQAVAPYTTVNGFGVQRIANAWHDRSQRVAIEANTNYTLSAWIKWENTADSMIFYTNTGTMSGTNVSSQVGTTDYKRVSITFNSGNATVSTCRFECSSNTPYLIYGLKLEKGNKATDWSPAPEDIDNNITDVKNSLNSVQTTVNNNKNNWSNAYNRVAEWAKGAVTGSVDIDGGKIAANTIIAEKIAVGDFNNYATVSELNPATMLPSSHFGGTKIVSPNSTTTEIAKTNSSNAYLMLSGFIPTPFVVNDELLIGFKAYNCLSENKTVTFSVWYYDANKKHLNSNSVAITLTSKTWKDYEASLKLTSINTNVRYVVIGFNDSNGTDLRIRNPRVVRKSMGKMIVDGTIEARHIKSDVLSASTIVSTINNGTTTISGGKITSGTITTNHIHTNGLNANVIKAGTISADRLDANTIVSKVNGGTTEINGNRIQTGTLSADKITTGTLDANKVNVTNLNASNITSGTIDASKISVTNLNASNITSGTLRSGGYNLLRNSGFKNEKNYWYEQKHNNPTGGIFELISSSATWGYPDASVKTAQIKLNNQSGIEYGISQSFNTTIGKQYTLTFQYAGHRVSGANAIIRNPNSSWLANKSFTPTNYNGGNGNVNNWGTYSLTFTATATSHILNIVINNAQNDGYIWVAKPQIVEGAMTLPYSPHPNEIYGGSTVIDADGITVNNGAIKIKNKAGNTVLSGDSNGNLTLNGTIKSEAGSGQYVGLSSGGITFKDSRNSEEVLRIGTSFSNNNRDINGVTFAMPQYSDRISFRHIQKPSLENGWDGSEAKYTFMEMWSTDYNHPNGKNYKGVNVFAPMYLNQKIRFRNGGDQYLHEVTPNITWNNMDKLMGIYGDNGSVLGCKSADNLHSRIVVTESNHPGTGDWIKSWGNWNCSGYTVHNATFNGRHVNSYANTETRTVCNTAAVMTEGNQVRVNFENVQIKDGKAILSIPKRYRGINEGYTIASIVKKGRGDVWVSEEEEERFIIEAENDIKINIEVIIKLTEAVVARTLKHEDSICYEVPNEQPEGDCC